MRLIFLAGLEGLEPPNAGIRIRCLTNLAIAQYLLLEYDTKKECKCQDFFKNIFLILDYFFVFENTIFAKYLGGDFMKNKIRFIMSIVLSLGLILTGCALDKNRKVAIFYNETQTDESTETVRNSLVKELNNKNIVYESFSSASDNKNQIEQIEHVVKDGTDILVVNTTDNMSKDDVGKIVSIASGANMPLVFFGIPVDANVLDNYSKSVYIGSDSSEAQKVQGNMIGKYLLDNYELIDLNKDGKISYAFYGDLNLETTADTHINIEAINRLLSHEGKPAIEYYDSVNPPILFNKDDNEAVFNHMTQALTNYNVQNNNMIELVIAERDEWALSALEALKNSGYNQVRGTKIIPIFGIGATIAAQNALYGGMMTGTVCQDSEHIANIIETVCLNMMKNKDKFRDIDKKYIKGNNRINVPYSEFYGRNNM